MDRHSIGKYFRTLQYLKFIQIYYRIFYLVRNKIYKKNYYSKNQAPFKKIYWENTIFYQKSYFGSNTFQFLNTRHEFKDIDWNFNKYGRLWNYNLVYFDFLNQNQVDTQNSLNLIRDFIKKDTTHISGHEPYTISLRNMNWIKFLSSNNVKKDDINNYIYTSYLRLLDNLEFHLLGNHLLENAFSLLFGAHYFNSQKFYSTAENILLDQLDKQILDDGGHFELSPMYHSIILHRILDSISIIENNNLLNSDKLHKKLKKSATLMLSWLDTIKYKNNNIPHFNDSTNQIAFSTNDLFKYAKILGIEWSKITLSDSGYRKYSNEHIECILDVGLIGPDYLPGHGHSDIFNFELYYEGLPFIIDTGISTYDNNKQRHLERSTSSHNTIMVNNENQSEVWDSFRVGKRATVYNLIEEKNSIDACHDGYKHLNVIHNRKFIFNSKMIIIKDNVKNPGGYCLQSFLHFHPSREIKYINNSIYIDNKIELKLSNYFEVKIQDYDYCKGFNNTIKSKKIVATIGNNSKIEIIYILNK